MKNQNLSKFHLIIMFLLLTGISAFFAAFVNPGNEVKQNRNVSSFNSLDISSAFHVYLTQGDKESLTVEADEEYIDRIVTEMEGSTLKIYWKKGEECRNAGDLNIYLTFKELSHMEISGAVHLESESKLKFDDLSLELSGATHIELPLSANMLEADISGASKIELNGSCDKSSMEISGASEVDAGGLEVEYLSIETSGASKVTVNVRKELDAEVSGASCVKYYGRPELKSDVSGAGKLESKD